MNKFKRLTALLIAAVMSATMLAACGNKVEEPLDNPDVSDVSEDTSSIVSSDSIVSSLPDETSAPTTSDTEPEVTTAPENTTQSTPTTTEDDGSFTVEDMSTTMYATDSVNVRSGPGADYEKIGRFDKNEAVTVTGRASTGWYRVLLDGKTGYVSNAYLTETKPSSTTTTKTTTSNDPDVDLNDDDNSYNALTSFDGFGDAIEDNGLEYTVSIISDSRYETAIRQILEGIQNLQTVIYIDPVIYADEAYDFAAQILPTLAVEYCYVSSVKAVAYSSGENKGKIQSIKVSYYYDTIEQCLDMVNKLRSKTDSVLSNVKSSWSNYQKVKYIHDWLVLNCTPDAENIGGTWAPTAYGAIVDGRPTCLGYAKATLYMLSKLGFDVVFDVGTGTSAGHVWVKVKLDGSWYCIDTTWDDPVDPTVTDPQYIRYDYFLQTDDYMTQTHMENFEMRFFSEPKATSTKLNWFVVNDCYVTSASEAETILKNAAKKAVEGGSTYEYVRILCSSVDVYNDVLATYGGKSLFNSKILSGISSEYSCDVVWGGTKSAYPSLHQRTLTFRLKK